MFKSSRSILFLSAVLGLAPIALASVSHQSESLQTFDSSFAAPTKRQQEEVSRLLKDISAAAFQTTVHAGRLESFVRMPGLYKWQTHASELNHAKELINSKGRTLERPKELRSEVLPWQQRAIGRIHPLLATLAEETNKAIQHTSENCNWLHAPAYKQAISNIYIHADEVRDSVAVKLDYAEAKAKLDEVEAEPVPNNS